MAEIDPVVVELRAEVGRFRREILSTTNMVEASLAKQERATKNLERQMRASSAGISSSLSGLAGAFAGAFSVQQIAALVDRFTRLQNSLRVSGLEGEALATVQQRLLDLSAKYGVSINALGDLYGKAAQSAAELGASESQLLSLTEATSQALLITGTSATQAQGAILGLSQALAGGVVRAEEFNQINEGGLRPLLQAAANAERFGGSVARLRAAMLDGKVTSQEFFTGILENAGKLDTQASRATLTLAGAFESLSSQLVVYVGQAASSSGATAALAAGIKGLADNLDVLIPALASVGGALLVGYTVNAIRARVATLALGASAVGAAGGMGTLGFAAGTAGRSLLAAFGGPAGIAIIGVGAALAYANTEAFKLRGVTEETRRVNQAAAGGATALQSAIDRLASSYGRAREEALSLIRAQRQIAAYNLSRANSRFGDALDNVQRVRSANVGGGRGASARDEALDLAQQELDAAGRAQLQALRTISQADAALRNPPRPGGRAATPSATGSGGSGRTRTPRGSDGPSAEEVQRRFADELVALAQQTLSARARLATTADEEAELALRGVENARRQALAGIESEKTYSETQRERLRLQVEALATAERANVERDRQLRLEQESAELREQQFRNAEQSLSDQMSLADSQAERQRIALALVDLEYRYQESLLQAVIANEALATAERERARLALAGLREGRAAAEESAARGNETSAQAFMRELSRSREAINEDIESIAVDGLNSLNDGIADAILGAESLGDAFKDVANSIIRDLIRIAVQQAIIKPLAEGLFGGGSGGGGGIFSLIGGLFGRASGGYVAPGQLVRVNEGRGSGVEGFRPTGSGNVIPLGQMNAMAAKGGQAGGVVTVRLQLSGDIDARIAEGAAGVAIEVVRAAAPGIVDAASRQTLNAASRQRLG